MQLLLFPDSRPLVERLGREFFRQLPETAGVYLMRDAVDTVLYVGKARNLRKRLGSYRVANPDRLPRRHLRLLRAVARIELQECPDEPAALAREAELLRSLKPRFNRAGTWSGPPRYLAWTCAGPELQLEVTGLPLDGWHVHGPLGAGAAILRQVLVRLLWLTLYPQPGIAGLPAGWVRGQFGGIARLNCGRQVTEVQEKLESLASGQTAAFCDWIRLRQAITLHPFERALVEKDLEHLAEPPFAGPEIMRSAGSLETARPR
jgi:predicted GIY-YIG superfamily endonuclease